MKVYDNEHIDDEVYFKETVFDAISKLFKNTSIMSFESAEKLEQLLGKELTVYKISENGNGVIVPIVQFSDEDMQELERIKNYLTVIETKDLYDE